MSRQLHMLPECYADTLLVNRLIRVDFGANHKHSISKVFTALKKDFRDRHALGIIDDDKEKDKYFNEFAEIHIEEHYRYMAHPNGRHFIIAIKGGGIERLLLSCAAEVGLQHPLLGDFKFLRNKTKSITEDPDIRSIINKLIQLESPIILRLRELIMLHYK